MDINELSSKIIGAAIEVHKNLGPGLLESAYEECLCVELKLRNLTFERQKSLPIEYKGQKAGFFVLSFESKAYLKNIQISSDFQNMGLGSQTLEHCELESVNRGFDTLFLEVFLDNPARQLYERLGYATFEFTESHYMMKKQLTSST